MTVEDFPVCEFVGSLSLSLSITHICPRMQPLGSQLPKPEVRETEGKVQARKVP